MLASAEPTDEIDEMDSLSLSLSLSLSVSDEVSLSENDRRRS